MSPNQNPEQIARDAINAQLRASGRAVQAKDAINFHAAEGQAVREYSTDTGPALLARLRAERTAAPATRRKSIRP